MDNGDVVAIIAFIIIAILVMIEDSIRSNKNDKL